MKVLELAKRITALLLVLIVVAVVIPVYATEDNDDTEYFARYNPYEQFMGKAADAPKNARSTVDYSGIDFSVMGSYYEATLAPMDSTWRETADNIFISELSATDTNGHHNNCNFICSQTYSNAVGSRLATNKSGGMIKLSFKAPEAGVYKLVPVGITSAGGHSMLLTSPQSYTGQKPEYFEQTFTVMQGENVLFKKTLLLDNYNDVTADIPNNISVTLAKGEELSFFFESSEDWGRTNLYVNFELWLTEYSSDSVVGVYFDDNNYLVKMGSQLNISPVVVPSTASNQKVNYTVDNENILSVDSNGNVTPKKAGYTRVAVKTEDGGFEAETNVCVYENDAPIYNVKALYDQAVEKIGSVSAVTTVDNDIDSAWQPMYLNGDTHAVCEKVTREPWGGSNFGIKFHAASGSYTGSYGGLSQYMENGSLVHALVYGRQDTKPHGAALLFTAPEYGIYTLASDDDISLSASVINYMKNDKNANSANHTVNIYLNGNKLYSETLTINKTSVAFPVLNSLEMNKGDTVKIELVTDVWEKGSVILEPKMIKVLSEKPIVPTTGIALSDSTVTLSKGGTHTLIATVLPVTASNKEVTFTSSNEKVAAVSQNGVITAVAPGNATVTATCTAFPEFSASCEITVTCEKLNFINSVWQPTRDALVDELALKEYTIEGQFAAGVLSDGVYTDFEYALMHDWGNPRAVLFTNDPSETGNNKAKQSVNIYDGKSSIGSYTAESWVYAGYKADADGEYTISPSETCKQISLCLASYCTVEDLIKWGEDLPFYVRITKNGETIWPQGAPKGVEMKPSGVSAVDIPTISGIKLYKGDTIRLEVFGQSKIPSRHVTVLFDFDVMMDNAIAVNKPVSSVLVSQSACELSIEESYQLTASVIPADADNKNIRWVSSDPQTVKVNSTGKLTALKQGSAVIYAISEENGVLQATCNVTVTSFKIISYTPDEMKDSLHAQLNGEVVVSAKAVELDTNWSAQMRKTDADEWSTISALTTYDWKNTGTPACYAFLYASQTSVGMENVSGYLTPYVATTQPQMALVFTADRAGTYSITPDLRNGSIYLPGTYVNGRIEPQDRNKEYKFSIEVNGKEIYSVMVSAVKNSFAFPNIDNIFLNARDTVRFIIKDNPESSSPIDVYFSPVISLVRPDKTDHAPIADDKEYILEPDKTFNTKIKAIHPNGREIRFDILTENPNATLKIEGNGALTYIPRAGYKGIDVRKVRLSDSLGKTVVVTLTFMVANEYDAVEAMSAVMLAADTNLADDGAKGIDWGKSLWKYQYTYDGLSYANGSPKYYDTDSVEVIKNAGWWGYNTYSDKMPQACVTAVNGVAAIRVMAGHSPWGKNAIGGITFIAPNDGTYLIRGNQLFDKIILAADLEKDMFKNPMSVWIAKNGKKIWPIEESSIKLSRDITEADFPELKVALQKGDTLRVCISGNDYNERQNLVAVAPTVFDIGAYDKSLDPNPEKEGGNTITDDDGEPMVKYDKFSIKTDKLSSLKGNYSSPVVKTGFTVDKIKELKQTEPFAFEISYDSCDGAAGYVINVYRQTEEGYELFFELNTDKLSEVISELEAGQYSVQVSAVDDKGQYIEIYTSRKFSVDDSGNITFEKVVNVLTVILIAVPCVLVLAAAVVTIIIIRRRKRNAKA